MTRMPLKSFVFLALLLLVTCNVQRSGSEYDDIWDAGVKPDLRNPPPCMTLGCKVAFCKGTHPTTLTGTVNIPAGGLPLPNAYVYVPASPVDPIPEGVSCNRCDAPLSGNPIAKATTDATGSFRLENVPYGDIPLVIQLGKWRRQVIIPQVEACTDNAVDADLTRLPRNQAEGNIPKLALSTGSADALECLLRKVGLADSEFTLETGSGRINLYAGYEGTDHYDSGLNGGAAFTQAPDFWDKLDNLKKYDVILHSCEGAEILTNKSTAARQALYDYLSLGGRAFGSHYHYVWIEDGPPPMPTIATWSHRVEIDSVTGDIDTSFDRGNQFADWLVNVGASTSRGKLPLDNARNDVMAVDPRQAQSWITVPSQSSVQYFSFNAPLDAGEAGQCGRMVYTDIHVSSDSTQTGLSFPSGRCVSSTLSPQEKALIYMFFDLSNCLQPMVPPG